VVESLDRDLPVYDAVTRDRIVTRALGPPKFYLLLLAVFAALAVVLAAVGIYGVMAYTVQQRTREIGIRMALGAQQGDVVRRVLRRGLVLTALGIAIGTAGSLAMTRSLATLLHEVSPTDPLTFSLVAVVLAAVALLGSWLPARRAAAVDPVIALRDA
jgi:ABC-type antimicrobial peptide transport system permease subunit